MTIFFCAKKITILFVGVLCIVFLWFPAYHSYQRDNSSSIQRPNDVSDGFFLQVRSPIGICYAHEHVALSGSKETGYTKFLGNSWQHARISIGGFGVLFTMSICIAYLTHRVLCNCTVQPKNEKIGKTH